VRIACLDDESIPKPMFAETRDMFCSAISVIEEAPLLVLVAADLEGQRSDQRVTSALSVGGSASQARRLRLVTST
jgi:hypothetical protein